MQFKIKLNEHPKLVIICFLSTFALINIPIVTWSTKIFTD